MLTRKPVLAEVVTVFVVVSSDKHVDDCGVHVLPEYKRLLLVVAVASRAVLGVVATTFPLTPLAKYLARRRNGDPAIIIGIVSIMMLADVFLSLLLRTGVGERDETSQQTAQDLIDDNDNDSQASQSSRSSRHSEKDTVRLSK